MTQILWLFLLKGMALVLDIVILPTYNTYNMAIVDNSTYPTSPPAPNNPWLTVDVPGFGLIYSEAFIPVEATVLNSTDFGWTTAGSEIPLPDGVYTVKYTNNPAYTYYVEKSIMRVDRLQEKFDSVFMKLDMMECDRAIKVQSKIELNTIWFLIQGAIAAANNCANVPAEKLYAQANTMLDNMLSNGCNCSDSTYLLSYY